ncbi:uncharacterized protein CLUP02_17246 [Colletotrichum lupini]|uniref:FAD-binding domain-containing protein n=1 Tax=Colletotrichum lupini TaxID=145971 RepID=A0A9Q8SES1_9PEZI|nr:uncharacterized protein CLUP02_17246 [Colletotrichum lupini]KAK1713297.1 hypothetical protein BDP67DRAFT_467082 [Colletotrichum lupini]UQC75738.1 hypothetical protein CLUP02_17246 [Colletotrichum lupini]
MGENFEASRIRVGILGAGIAGCCLAVGLLQNPLLDVQLFERYSDIRVRGSGLAPHGNAIRAMDLISPKIKRAYFKKSHFMAGDENTEMATQFKLTSGEHAGVIFAELGRAKGRRTVHRAHFIQGLLEEDVVPHQRVHFSKRVAKMEEDPLTRKITVAFEDGTQDVFDIVFGAEGVNSPTRKFVLGPGHPNAAPVNHDQWRQFHTTVPMCEAKMVVPVESVNTVITYCTPYGFINAIPLDLGQTFSVGCYQRDTKCPERGVPLDPQLWKGSLPGVDALISLLEKGHTEDWTLQDHDHAPSYYRGRVAMVGDAAHGTLPHSGNGAAQAIEDCSVLTGIFLRLTSLDEVEAAFKSYDQVRIPRSQKIVEITRSFGRLYSRDPHEIVLDEMKAEMREGGIYINGVDMEAQVESAVDAFERFKGIQLDV